MNSLIQILFVNSDNGFADESQVYSFALLCRFPWGKKIKIISPFVCFFLYFKWFGPNLLSVLHVLF